jgi:hypothetical protein
MRFFSMAWVPRIFALLVLVGPAPAQKDAVFAPLERWKTALTSGNSSSLVPLYSTNPAPQLSVVIKKAEAISAQQDAEFWAGLKARRVVLNIAQSETPQPGLRQLNFEVTVKPAPPGRTVYVVVAQIWQQQGADWKLVAAQRTEAQRLEQPLSTNAKLYPADDAKEEVQQALARAAKSRKRVLVVFGADWCYDCHVLDKAFKRPDVAAVLTPNFEVVHVDVGTGDKNQDLMNQYQVPMSRGIPGMAVLDEKGKLLFSQKNGEFERARALGPEDLVDFFNKWKPQTR